MGDRPARTRESAEIVYLSEIAASVDDRLHAAISIRERKKERKEGKAGMRRPSVPEQGSRARALLQFGYPALSELVFSA